MENQSSISGKRQLPARIFYSVVLAGFLLGILIFTLGGLAYLESSEAHPTGRRIWESSARDFVIPVCCMIGATFGGIMGVAVAVVASGWKAQER